MKTLYTLLFLSNIIFANAIGNETLLRPNFGTNQSMYGQPSSTKVFYIGGNQLLTVNTLQYYDGDYHSIYQVMVNDLSGNTLMHTSIQLDTALTNPVFWDAGKVPGGGYYFYAGNDSRDSLNNQISNLLLIKLNDNGSMAWNTKITLPDFAYNATPMVRLRTTQAGEFYLNGNTDHYATVCKVSSSGNFEWGRMLTFTPGTSKTPLPDMTVTGDTGVILVVNPNQSNTGFVHVDANGNVNWGKNFQSSGFAFPTVVVSTSDGNYVAGGSTWGTGVYIWKVNASGTILWRKVYNLSGYCDMIELTDGTLVVASGGGYGMPGTLLHLSANGDILEKKVVLGGNTVVLGNLVKDGNGFALPAAISLPTELSPSPFVMQASALSEICETLNTPVTAKNDTAVVTVEGTTNDLTIQNFSSDNTFNVTVDNTVIYSATAVDYCSYMTAIKEVANDGHISVYPVPATDEITVQLPSSFSNSGGLKIMAMNGELLQQQTIHSAQTILSVSSLPKGVYILQVDDNATGQSFFSKFVVVK